MVRGLIREVENPGTGKTQTRRTLKPQPTTHEAGDCTIGGQRGPVDYLMREIYPRYMARFRKGDRLWVLESGIEFKGIAGGSDMFRHDVPATSTLGHYWIRNTLATGASYMVPGCTREAALIDKRAKVRPSVHMPRWASRLTLTVTDVRVQRLQEISEEDCIAEGATSRPNCSGAGYRDEGWSMDWSPVGTRSKWASADGILRERDVCLASPRLAFANLIDRINGAGSWAATPWIVALTFTVERRNIDA